MHHAAVQGVAHAVDDEGIENETRIRRHIRNRMPPFFDKWETHRAVPVQNEPVTVQYSSLFAGGPSGVEANCAP